MKTLEVTLLKCFIDHSLVVDIEPVFHQLDGDKTSDELVLAVIETGHGLRQKAGEKSALVLDRLLNFAGHLEPLLSPRAFMEAAEAHSTLVQGKLARFFPGLHPIKPNDQTTDQATIPAPPFRYRTTNSGNGDREGLQAITVLTKNHLDDTYELTELMVDSKTPAESILQFLAEMTDGRFQPVAAFGGMVQWFDAEKQSAPPGKEQRRKPVADSFGQILATLLDAALVQQGFLADAPLANLDRGLDWLTKLLHGRAVVAIESELPFAEQTLALAIKEKLAQPLVIVQPSAPPEMALQFAPPPRPSLVVLPMSAYPQVLDPERVAHELMTGGHSALIGCGNLKNLPEPLRRITENTISLPRIDRTIFARLFAAVFGAPPPPQADDAAGTNGWIQYLQPWDMARIARIEADPRRAYAMMQHRVEDRLQRLTPQHGQSLAELYGLGEARVRAEMLITDIQAAAAGKIPWSQVDRGMLLAGPPGCGKTALARAIAKDCGVRFVECSAARWQMAGHLGDHLAAMARDFAEARRFEPSILFIDEIDSIGSREQFSGDNATYHIQVVNALLAELQGFSGRGKVIVIAATNFAENVDPALRRAGRLDRVIKVSLPTIDALEKIFAHYLKKNDVPAEAESDIVLRPLAEAAFGRTGADVSLAVRGALRRARMAARPLCQDDLLAELFERPLERDLDRPLSGEGIRRVALHEAGHALIRLKSGGALRQIGYISIVPRGDGSLGFVALKPNADVTTLSRVDYLAHLEVILGGRAAEEIFYGPEGVGGGAGGGEESDLAKATALALDMVCRLGLGHRSQLLWREEPSDADYQEAEELIAEAYIKAKEVLANNRVLAERITAILVERQEISGEELVHILG